MIYFPNSGGRPSDSSFWNVAALERYATASEFVALEAVDAFGPLSARVTAAPKSTITSLYSGGALSIPRSLFGIHSFTYPTGTPPLAGPPTFPVGIIRTHDQQCHWPNIETSAGVYNWNALDSRVNWAQQIGVDVVQTIAFTPTFYASDTSVFDQYGRAGGSSNPTAGGLTAFSAFCTAMATRYKGKIKYYEIWNEPNFRVSATVGTWFGTDAQMVNLCSLARTAILAVDPAAKIISGGPVGETSGGFGGAPAGPTYLANFLTAGGGAQVDIIGYHFYLAFNRDPSYLPTYYSTVQGVMTAGGVGAKPLWCTEIGNQEVYTYNNQKPMPDLMRAKWNMRSLVYLALAGCPVMCHYNYDGGPYVGSDGLTRCHGMLDQVTKAASIQSTYWNTLYSLIAGSSITYLNKLASGELAISSPNGTLLL